MFSEKARPVLEFIEQYKIELLKTYMKYCSVLRCAINKGGLNHINATQNRENQYYNELVNGVFASSGFSDLENYICRAATNGYGMTVDNSVVVYPDNPFKEIEDQENANSLLLKKDVFVYSMDASKFEPVVDFELGRDGLYNLRFGQEWISRNNSLECEQEMIDRVPKEMLERKQVFYKKQRILKEELQNNSKEEFLDKFSELISSDKLGYVNGKFNINSIINNQIIQEEIGIRNLISDIINRIDNNWNKKDIVKFVHIELGKVLMYDNSYSDNKEDKDNDNSDMTHMSKERREKLLSDETSLDTNEQICKGMAEINAAILSQFGIDAKVIGVEQEGDLDGIPRDNSDEVITVPEIYSVKFENGKIIAGDNEQTKHSSTKAQHYYTKINIDGEEYIEDFLIKETLPRIKMGETTIDSEKISGLCPKEKFREALKTAVPMQEEFKKKLESEIHNRYGKEVSLKDKLEFIFDKLQQEESKMGYEDANKYFWFLQENIVNADDMKQVTSRKIITFIKETKESADIVRVYSINGKNYCVRGNLDRFENLPPIGEISEQQIYEILNAGYEVRGFKDKESFLDITEHKEKSILDSAEEAIVTHEIRKESVDEQFDNIIKTKQERGNSIIEKDSSDIGIDDE